MSRPPFEPELPDQGPPPPWAQSVRRELDAHAEALEGATRSRLNRARQAALDEAARPRGFVPGRRARWWLPASVAATAALVLAIALHPPPGEHPGGSEAAASEDLELIQQGESLELYEDQEFYAWLDAADPSSG